jgi:hypothetical protein
MPCVFGASATRLRSPGPLVTRAPWRSPLSKIFFKSRPGLRIGRISSAGSAVDHFANLGGVKAHFHGHGQHLGNSRSRDVEQELV